MRIHFITHRNTRTILLSDFLKEDVNVLLRRPEILQHSEFYYKDSLRFSILFRNKSTACIRSMMVMFDNDETFVDLPISLRINWASASFCSPELVHYLHLECIRKEMEEKLQNATCKYIAVCPVFV